MRLKLPTLPAETVLSKYTREFLFYMDNDLECNQEWLRNRTIVLISPDIRRLKLEVF